MKKFIFSLIILIIALLFYKCSDLVSVDNKKTSPLNASEQKIVSSTEVFGLKLFKEINNFEGSLPAGRQDKNIFISPLSVSMALGMTLNGANGNTYDSMRSVLELNGLTEQEINESYKNLIDLLVNLDPKVIFTIANSIWYKNTMLFEQDFINTNKKYFNAEIAGLNFEDPASVDIINNWVKQNTNGKIKKILDMIPADAVMYLMNAIYFKGDWKYQFDKDLTKDDFFTTIDGSKVPCKMMHQGGYCNYLSNELFQSVELPYGDSSFSMIIFLPKEHKSIDDIIKQFDETNWNEWLSQLRIREGEVQLPKFELKYELTMNNVLKAMGMGIAFSGAADFTKMFAHGGLAISEVKHKTYIKVDEEGTEAAAVTIVGVKNTSVGGSRFYMRMDKPFIFVIKDNQANSILFMGKIINPSGG